MRFLDVLEWAGFAAVAAGLGLGVYSFGGLLAGIAMGVVVGGMEMIYVANAYALPPVEGGDDA